MIFTLVNEKNLTPTIMSHDTSQNFANVIDFHSSELFIRFDAERLRRNDTGLVLNYQVKMWLDQ